MNEIKLIIHPFEMDTLKEAAKKVQEEAGEAFAEYVIIQEQKDRSTTRLADEIADTIQASCNLAARYNIDLQGAMERCEKRNRERGRYPMEDEDAKTVGTCGRDDCNCGGGGGAIPVGDNAQKSPEEMSADELIETLKATTSGLEFQSRCKIILGDDWCKNFFYCFSCRNHLLVLLKERYQERVEGLEQEVEYHKENSRLANRDCDEARKKLEEMIEKNYTLRQNEDALGGVIESQKAHIAELNQHVSDLAHERDGLRRRLEELSEAGITELHRLLRETVGEAKNITHNARVYIEKQQGSKDEHCGSRGSDRRDHGSDCGAQCAGEHLLSEKPPAQEVSERETVIERLREIEFDGDNVTLSNICVAVMGCDPSLRSRWNETTRRELRDKLIELLSDGE